MCYEGGPKTDEEKLGVPPGDKFSFFRFIKFAFLIHKILFSREFGRSLPSDALAQQEIFIRFMTFSPHSLQKMKDFFYHVDSSSSEAMAIL